MIQKIWTMLWKDTIIRFSSKSELLFFLILPVIFTALLGGFMAPDPDADNRIPLLVVNEDGSPLAGSLLDALEQSGSVRVEAAPLADAEAAFAAEEAPALLRIPAGFGDELLAGETAVLHFAQLPNNNNGNVAARAVQTAVADISQPIIAARSATAEAASRRPFVDDEARAAFFSASLAVAQELSQALPQRVTLTQPEAALIDVNAYDPAAQSSAGQMITWVFIPLLGASAFLAFERGKGTLRRLLTTPTGKAAFMLGAITSNYLQALAQMAILIAFGIFVMRVNWGQSLPALALLLLAFGLAGVALGVMLGTFVKTTAQANNLSIMLGMAMALLGGCWWPLELFPPAMQNVVKALPTTWAMQGLTDLAVRGQGVQGILAETAVLLGFAALFFAIGVRRFRFE
jgi:ABC-2 type transport system permease protein